MYRMYCHKTCLRPWSSVGVLKTFLVCNFASICYAYDMIYIELAVSNFTQVFVHLVHIKRQVVFLACAQ